MAKKSLVDQLEQKWKKEKKAKVRFTAPGGIKGTIDLEEFIETANAFEVMGTFRENGVLTEEDVDEALGMDRGGWLKFMKEKAGLIED